MRSLALKGGGEGVPWATELSLTCRATRTNHGRVPGYKMLRCSKPRQGLGNKTYPETAVVLTVAWYPRERDVHPHVQLLPTTLVHQNRCVDIDSAVVKELNGRERKNDGGRNEGHCLTSANTTNWMSGTQHTERASTRFDLDIFGSLPCTSECHCHLND